MLEKYRETVHAAYKKKFTEGPLARNLQQPSPAKLRNECQIVYHERPSPEDDETLRVFFGSKGERPGYEHTIKNVYINKMKPLINFMNGETTITEDKNVELLAWLIDFNPRPYSTWKKRNVISTPTTEEPTDRFSPTADVKESIKLTPEIENKETKNIIDETRDENSNQDAEEKPPTPADDLSIISQNFGVPRKFNRAIVAFFAAFVILSGTYIFYNAGDHQCMYWDVDHFTAIPCDQKVDGATIIALDTFRLVRLKKITNLKLITPNGIGKIHYSKLYGKVEFYTTGGENPTDHRKRLLPMTEFIYRKYVLKLD